MTIVATLLCAVLIVFVVACSAFFLSWLDPPSEERPSRDAKPANMSWRPRNWAKNERSKRPPAARADHRQRVVRRIVP